MGSTTPLTTTTQKTTHNVARIAVALNGYAVIAELQRPFGYFF